MSETHPSTVLQNPALAWTGTRNSLFGIFFKNLLLTIVTLGVYRFWAITNMRRYLWSNIRVAGQPLEYTGAGGELLRGFLMATLLLVLTFAGAFAIGYGIAQATGYPWMTLNLGLWIFYPVMLLLVFAAYFLGRRYLMTRTSLRGIRFGQDGSPVSYALQMFGQSLLTVFTVGFYTPWMIAARLQRTVGETRWGNVKFAFKGEGKSLFLWYLLSALCILVAVIVIVVAIIFLMASTYNNARNPIMVLANPSIFIVIVIAYFVAVLAPALVMISAVLRFTITNTTIDNDAMRFSLTASVWKVMGLVASNMLIVIFSLGLLAPIAIHRVMQFLTTHITLTGSLDLARVAQTPDESGQLSNIIGAGFNI